MAFSGMGNKFFKKTLIDLNFGEEKYLSSDYSILYVKDNLNNKIYLIEFAEFISEDLISFLKSVKKNQPDKNQLNFHLISRNIYLKNELNKFFQILSIKIDSIADFSDNQKKIFLHFKKTFSDSWEVIVGKEEKKVTVLVIEDSPTFAGILTSIINKIPGIEVSKVSANFDEAHDYLKNNSPDIITLDVLLTSGNSLEILKKFPHLATRSLVISDSSAEQGSLVLDMLGMGAFSYLKKPVLSEMDQFKERLTELILNILKKSYPALSSTDESQKKIDFSNREYILIGSSTGGTEVIKEILSSLPKDFPPIIIVQHMPPDFTGLFAQRLSLQSGRKTIEVVHEVEVKRGEAYLASGGKHLKVKKHGSKLILFSDTSDPVNRFRPSVSVLFQSALDQKIASKSIALMLTGMGQDGVHEMKALRDQGCICLAQNEETCVVFGMPRAAIEAGAVDLVLSPSMMISKLTDKLK
jgi:two-component system chemotaxis response regulator CheB